MHWTGTACCSPRLFIHQQANNSLQEPFSALHKVPGLGWKVVVVAKINLLFCSSSSFDLLTPAHLNVASVAVEMWSSIFKMLKQHGSRTYLCCTQFKVRTWKHIGPCANIEIMKKHLTDFPCTHVPHLLITLTQRTAWNISHINTSSVPKGEASHGTPKDPLIQEHVATSSEDVKY